MNKKILITFICIFIILTSFSLWHFKDIIINIKIPKLQSTFSTQRIETYFSGQAIKLYGNEKFQFATLTQEETFQRRSIEKILWQTLSLPEVIVSARVPVQYTYYLDFKGEWLFKFNGTILTVKTPPIMINEPAADISKLKFEIQKGSIFRNETAVMKKLQKQMMDHLRMRAKTNITLVKEMGRKKVEEFIRNFILINLKTKENLRIKIYFPTDQKKRHL